MAAAERPAPPVFDVPRVQSAIVVDGRAGDWGHFGLETGDLLDPENDSPAGSFAASARLAWDDAGLYILVKTSGGFGIEADNPGAIYQASGIEIFVSPNHFNGAPAAEARSVLQPIIASGRDPRHPKARCYLYDNRLPDLKVSSPPECEFAATHQGDRTFYEVGIPWSQFATAPREGLAFGVQIHANDADASKRLTQLRWNTAPGMGQALRLAGPGSARPVGTATASYENMSRIRVIAQTAPAQNVRAVSGANSAEAITNTKGRAVLHLPMPAWGEPGGPIHVMDAEGNTFAWIELPNATKVRHAFLESMPLAFSGDNVFAGNDLPALDPLPEEATASLVKPSLTSPAKGLKGR